MIFDVQHDNMLKISSNKYLVLCGTHLIGYALPMPALAIPNELANR